jgi:hypothetical protein
VLPRVREQFPGDERGVLSEATAPAALDLVAHETAAERRAVGSITEFERLLTVLGGPRDCAG